MLRIFSICEETRTVIHENPCLFCHYGSYRGASHSSYVLTGYLLVSFGATTMDCPVETGKDSVRVRITNGRSLGLNDDVGGYFESSRNRRR